MNQARLSASVDLTDYQRLKALLSLRGITIKDWLNKKIREELAKEQNQKHN